MTKRPIYALEAKYYTDPRIFEREKHSLLATTWQFAGHISQLKRKGDYITFSIAGENLFLIRDGAGEIRAFYNVCQHRGHELVVGEGTTNRIVCPYHSWVYELSGELRAGLNIHKIQGFNREEICLPQAKVENFHGFLFVNLDLDAAPMDVWFPKVREELYEFVPHIAELEPAQWVEIPEQTNWKISVENYSECYHCAKNHPTFANGVVKPETYDIRPQGHCLRHTTECQNLESMTYPIDLEANENAGKYSSWFLWPLFSFQVYPGNVLNTYHWRMDRHDRVTLWRGWYHGGSTSQAVAEQLAKQDRKTTVEEDIHLVESVQRGMMSRGYTPGPLVLDPDFGVNSEHSIQKLHEWTRAALSDSTQDGPGQLPDQL